MPSRSSDKSSLATSSSIGEFGEYPSSSFQDRATAGSRVNSGLPYSSSVPSLDNILRGEANESRNVPNINHGYNYSSNDVSPSSTPLVAPSASYPSLDSDDSDEEGGPLSKPKQEFVLAPDAMPPMTSDFLGNGSLGMDNILRGTLAGNDNMDSPTSDADAMAGSLSLSPGAQLAPALEVADVLNETQRKLSASRAAVYLDEKDMDQVTHVIEDAQVLTAQDDVSREL